MQNDAYRLSLIDATRMMSSGEMSAENYAHALLERAQRLEPAIHSFIWLNAERVLERARHSDQLRAAGKALGVLHGAPIGIKDVIDTRDLPTRCGSVVLEGRIPEKSATVVDRIEHEGGYVFGKTVTSEFAYFAPGPTRNPWNPAHTPGGSSMGSAAAVAAGLVPAAVGTQTNGSVIRPAAFCGCVGYKPTQGLISRTGVHPFAQTLDQLGVFARSVEDAGLFASALMGHDPEDKLSRPSARVQEIRDIRRLYQAPRLAMVRSPVWRYADAPAQAHFEETVSKLRTEGAAVEEIDLGRDFEQAHDVHRTLMFFGGAHTFAEIQSRERARLSDALNRLIDEGRDIDEHRLRDARETRTRLIGEFARLSAPFDAIVTPPTRGEAPATLESTGDPTFCTIWTLLGVPALTLPAGVGPHGLPLGLQCVSGFMNDSHLLAAAQWCQQTLDLPVSFPP